MSACASDSWHMPAVQHVQGPLNSMFIEYADEVCLRQFSTNDYPDLQEMVCVEAALASSGPVELGPGQTWTAKQVLVSSKL